MAEAGAGVGGRPEEADAPPPPVPPALEVDQEGRQAAPRTGTSPGNSFLSEPPLARQPLPLPWF